MVMKKILNVIMLLFVAIATTSFVFADEDNSTQVINESEEVVLATQYGAELRLAQLERRVDAQINAANIIIADLEVREKDVDYEKLNEIVDSMNAILIEIKAVDLDQDEEILAQQYVELKADIIDLSQEFRVLVGDAYDSQEKRELAGLLNENKNRVYGQYKQKLENAVRNYNAHQLGKIATGLGYDIDELKAQLESGNATINELKVQLRESYDNLSDEEKDALKQEIKEDRAKAKVEAKQKLEDRKAKLQELKENRQARIEAFKEQNRARIQTLKETQKEFVEGMKGLKGNVIGNNTGIKVGIAPMKGGFDKKGDQGVEETESSVE